MTERDVSLEKKGLLTYVIIFIVILILGLTLLALGYNEAFYSSSSTMQTIFKMITNLGEPIVFIVLVAIFYIIYDKKFAKNLALSLLITTYINEFAKGIFKDPRPATNTSPDKITPENPSGLIETSYGFPSGHTQSAVGTWGYIAIKFKDKPKPLIWPIILSIVIFLVGISRMVIGVHDLQDVVGGSLIGMVVLFLFIYIEPIATEKFNSFNLIVKLIIVTIVSIGLFLLGILLFPTSGTDLLPTPQPFTDTGGFAQVGGVFLGLGFGYMLEYENIKYQPSEMSKKQKIINLIIGLVLIFIIYILLDLPADLINSVFYRFARYALIAFILTYILPWIFVKIWKK